MYFSGLQVRRKPLFWGQQATYAALFQHVVEANLWNNSGCICHSYLRARASAQCCRPVFSMRRMNGEIQSITLTHFDSSLALWGSFVCRKALISHRPRHLKCCTPLMPSALFIETISVLKCGWQMLLSSIFFFQQDCSWPFPLLSNIAFENWPWRHHLLNLKYPTQLPEAAQVNQLVTKQSLWKPHD